MFRHQRQLIGLAVAGMAAVSLTACGSSVAGSGGSGGSGGSDGSGGSGSSGTSLTAADKIVCATAASEAWVPDVAKNADDPTLKSLAKQVPAGSPVSSGVKTALHKIVKYCDAHGYKAGS